MLAKNKNKMDARGSDDGSVFSKLPDRKKKNLPGER
jgi:hypothetical protein